MKQLLPLLLTAGLASADLCLLADDQCVGTPYVAELDGDAAGELEPLFNASGTPADHIVPTMGDVTGDGVADVLVAAWSGAAGSVGYAATTAATGALEVGALGLFEDVQATAPFTVALGLGGEQLFVSNADRGLDAYALDAAAGKFVLDAAASAALPGFNGSTVAAADLNGDGLSDLVLGTAEPRLRVFLAPDWAEAEEAFDAHVSHAAAVSLVDAENDGDVDAFVGDATQLRYFANVGNAGYPLFRERPGSVNPLNAVTEAYSGVVDAAVGDVDGDGVPEALVASADLGLLERWVLAADDALLPYFELLVDDNPLPAAATTAAAARPSVYDADGDGDRDVLLCSAAGAPLLYTNTGDDDAPAFTAGSAAPADAISAVGVGLRLECGDFDGDADEDDCVVGSAAGAVAYLADGAAADPNPLAAVAALNETDAAPTAADVDGDGDVDVLVGFASGALWLAVNDGSGAFALEDFSAQVPAPAGGAAVPRLLLADQGDRSVDVALGTGDGPVLLYTASGPPGARVFSLADDSWYFDGGALASPAFYGSGAAGISAFVGHADGDVAFARSLLCSGDCHYNGVCSAFSGECACLVEFDGVHCSECAAGFWGQDCDACACGERAECADTMAGSGNCTCTSEYYSGATCDGGECPAGFVETTIKDGSGLLTCEECQGDNVKTEPGDGSCVACPENSVASANHTTCECGTDLYLDEDSFTCLACPFGSFSSGGAVGPLGCECAEGAFRDGGDDDECACPTGAIVLGQACVECAEGTRAVDDTVCVECNEGEYAPAGADECTTCPKTGVTCVRGALRIKSAYWRSGDAPIDEDTAFYKCPLTDSCDVNATAGTVACSDHYTGPACGVCEDGYVYWHDTCRKCYSDAVSMLVIMADIVLVGVLVGVIVRLQVHKRDNKSGKSQIVRILFNYLFMLAAISLFDTKGPDDFWDLVAALWQLVQAQRMSGGLTLRIFPLWCVADLTYEAQFAMFVVSPVLLLPGVCVGMWLTSRAWKRVQVLRHRIDEDEAQVPLRGVLRSRAFQAAAEFLVLLLYCPLAVQLFEVFTCDEIEGVKYLAADYSVRCDTASYYLMVSTASVLSIVYVVLPPVVIVYACVRRQHAAHHDPAFDPVRRSFFTDGYQWPQLAWWEAVVFARKAAILAVAMFVGNNFVQNYLGTLVIGVAVVLQLVLHPYQRKLENRLETWSLIAMYVTAATATLFQEGVVSDSTFNAVIFTINGGLMLGLAFTFALFILYGKKRHKALTLSSLFARRSGAPQEKLSMVNPAFSHPAGPGAGAKKLRSQRSILGLTEEEVQAKEQREQEAAEEQLKQLAAGQRRESQMVKSWRRKKKGAGAPDAAEAEDSSL